MTREALLCVRDLKTEFATPDGVVQAVRGVSFQVGRGEVVAVVGESGCGKSVTCLSLLRLISPPGRIVAGSVTFEGDDVLAMDRDDLVAYRGGRVGMVFQNPRAALDPSFTVGSQLRETAWIHLKLRGSAAHGELCAGLRRVGISQPEEVMARYPHQLSGGMCQRVMIYLAIMSHPALLIADEPTTGLDAVVQARLLGVLLRLQRENRMAMIIVTHDLAVVAATADRIVVMYAGKVVETGPTAVILSAPLHPYTEALLRSIPVPGRSARRLAQIDGHPPSLTHPPRGCAFHPRCPHVMPACREQEPPLTTGPDGRQLACHLERLVHVG